MIPTKNHPTDTILTIVMTLTNNHLTDTILNMVMIPTKNHPTDTILNMVTTPTKNHPTDTIPTRSLTMNMRNLMIITRNHTNKNMNPSHTMIIKNLITRNHTNKNMNTSHTNKSMNSNPIRPLTINIKSLRMNISKTIP